MRAPENMNRDSIISVLRIICERGAIVNIGNTTGFVVGNSCLSAEVTNGGRMFQNIRFNPANFNNDENRIYHIAEGCTFFTVNGETLEDVQCKWTKTENVYPRYRATGNVTGTLTVDVEAFAPIDPACSDTMFLPVIITVMDVHNPDGYHVDIEYLLESKEECFIRINNKFSKDGRCRISVDSDERLVFVIGRFDKENFFRTKFADEEELSLYAAVNHRDLSEALDDFIKAIPTFGDDKIDEYFRWYTQASVLLTKADRNGTVITMGYHELNQRDSFWTSFMHLKLFPDLERRIIEISAANMRDDGKIPSTILPLIERNYDIDINEYFCLRIARYYDYYGDEEFLRKCYIPYMRSVDYLISMDVDGDSIPEQAVPENDQNYWADWKDVKYVRGRKLAPHFCLLWIAVLRYGIKFAKMFGDTERAASLEKMYDAAFEKINRDYDGTDNGGLWDRDHYAEVWYDGRRAEYVLEDQTAGIFFDVVPSDRVSKIYSALKKNETEYGIRETFPYRTYEGVFDEGGIYHNGGIWPWVNFCDYAGRYKNGREEEVMDMIRRLGYYDLELPGDYRPNEYLNGNNGTNMGLDVQGWSSAIWAVDYVRTLRDRKQGSK